MHSFHHMLVVDVKQQNLNKIQLSINHQANMTCLITTTKLLLLLSVPSTYANKKNHHRFDLPQKLLTSFNNKSPRYHLIQLSF